MEGPTLSIVALHGVLYLSNLMDWYGGTHTFLNIALHGGIYLPNIMDRYGGPHTALTIALHGGLYLANIVTISFRFYFTMEFYYTPEDNTQQLMTISTPVEL
jgi:hypothetical protein